LVASEHLKTVAQGFRRCGGLFFVALPLVDAADWR
jgi:hypothetical protein